MASEGEGQGALILVVEDNAANLLLMRALLKRAGYRLAEARSLAEARKCLEDHRPDLALLDRGLGDGDGLELLDPLKTAGIPAVIVSAYAMDDERERALQAGCAAYLTKPLDTRTFAAQVADVLRRVGREPRGG